MRITVCIQSLISIFRRMAWSNQFNITHSHLTWFNVQFNVYLNQIETKDRYKKPKIKFIKFWTCGSGQSKKLKKDSGIFNTVFHRVSCHVQTTIFTRNHKLLSKVSEISESRQSKDISSIYEKEPILVTSWSYYPIIVYINKLSNVDTQIPHFGKIYCKRTPTVS